MYIEVEVRRWCYGLSDYQQHVFDLNLLCSLSRYHHSASGMFLVVSFFLCKGLNLLSVNGLNPFI